MNKFDKAMMKTAYVWADESKCNRKKVGSVLSSIDGRILAIGYNGTIAGQCNSCEEPETGYCYTCEHIKVWEEDTVLIQDGDKYYDANNMKSTTLHLLEECPNCGRNKDTKMITNDLTLHAEQNLLMYCAKNGISVDNTILYVTMNPCRTCAKLIAQSGIKEVVYSEEYKDVTGIEFLEECGVKVRRYE